MPAIPRLPLPKPTAATPARVGYHSIDHPRARAFPEAEPRIRPDLDYLRAMLARGWGIRYVGELRECIVVVGDLSEWWCIGDNGGELRCWRINGGEPPTSVPYDQARGLVPIGRLAWFCALAVRGQPIPDYGPNPAVDDLHLGSFASLPQADAAG